MKKYDITIISDPHLIARDLLADTEKLKGELQIERKLVLESEGLFDAALENANRKNSKYLLIPGDLSKNGEKLSHLHVAEKLRKWKALDPEREIFLLPGNHDITDPKAYDFKNHGPAESVTPDEFMEIYDFTYNSPSIISHYRNSSYYQEYLDDVNENFKRYPGYEHIAQGYTSYAVRFGHVQEEGMITLIALDTSIYTADSTAQKKDGRSNIPGIITAPQIKWALDVIHKAKEKKDLVIIMAHHPFLPNYRNSEIVMIPFLIKNFNTPFEDEDERINGKIPIEALADASVKFLFTGHLHENGTARYDSALDNTLYDIQTGSTVTYPLPIRHLSIIEEEKTFQMWVDTEIIRDFTYTDFDGRRVYIDDAILYTLRNQIGLQDVIYSFVRMQKAKWERDPMNLKKQIRKKLMYREEAQERHSNEIGEMFFASQMNNFPKKFDRLGVAEIVEWDGTLIFQLLTGVGKLWVRPDDLDRAMAPIFQQIDERILTPENVLRWSNMILSKVIEMPMDTTEDKTFFDVINYIYQYQPVGEEEVPLFIQEVIDKLNDPAYEPLEDVTNYIAPEVNLIYDEITHLIRFDEGPGKQHFFRDIFSTNSWIIGRILWAADFFIKDGYDLLKYGLRFVFGDKINQASDILYKMLEEEKPYSWISLGYKYFGIKDEKKYMLDMILGVNTRMKGIYKEEAEDIGAEEIYWVEYPEDSPLSPRVREELKESEESNEFTANYVEYTSEDLDHPRMNPATE